MEKTAINRKLNLNIETLVIGCSLESLLYCYKLGIPFIYKTPLKPNEIHFTKDNKSKLNLWEDYFSKCNLCNLNLLNSNLSTIDINIKESKIKCYTETFYLIEIKYNKLIIFDDNGIENIFEIKQEFDEYEVIDWFDCKHSPRNTNNREEFIDSESIISKILLYKYYPGIGSKFKINYLTVGYMPKEKILKSYDPSIIRLESLRILANNGVTGYFHKHNKKYRKLESLWDSRDVYKIHRTIYENIDNIEFNYQTFEELDSMKKISYSSGELMEKYILCQKQ